MVGICVERSIEMVVGLFGILKAGGAYLPLDPAYPTERLAFMLEDAQVPVLLTQLSLQKKLPETKAQIICLDVKAEMLSRLSSENLVSGVGSENLAYVIYTSGSTGKPKGTLIVHQALCNHTQWMQDTFPLNEKDKVLQKTPISFDASVSEFYTPLIAGAQLVMAQPDWQKDSSSLIEMMAQHQVTTVQLVPSLLQVMIYSNKIKIIPSLKRIFCGGETLSLTLMKECFNKVDVELINVYGPTEACIDATFWKCFPNAPVVSIGSPIANTKIELLDSYLRRLPIGVPGELYIGGAGLARGYLNRPDLTAEKFIKNPFTDDPNSRLYKTGDLARYLPDGNIEYLGRIDNQVKIRGFRIELGEIEAVLAQHPLVKENAVIVHETSQMDKHLVVYLVPHQGQIIENKELRNFLRKQLPDYMIPSTFVTKESLPLTPNGKIDRRALSQLAVSSYQLSDKTFVAPRDALELQLVPIWENVLDVYPIGVQDNFFEMGGHSLSAVRLMAEIQQQFEQTLSVATLFQGATIEQLAKIIRQQTDYQVWSPLVAIQPHGSKPPFFCMPGSGGNVIYFHQLARHLGTEQPFYALQARGLDGESTPLTRVEDIASYYLEAIRRVQPQGPYLLGGHSFGALVAFEMAQQLQQRGQPVALLAILDLPALPPDRQPIELDWDNARWMALIAHILETLSGNSLDLSFKDFQPLNDTDAYQLLKERLERANLLPASADINQVRSIVQVIKADELAFLRYVPPVGYPNPITLFKTGGSYSDEFGTFGDILDELDWGWGRLSTKPVEIIMVPGNHTTILTEPYVQVLADKLRKCLEQASQVECVRRQPSRTNPLEGD